MASMGAAGVSPPPTCHIGAVMKKNYILPIVVLSAILFARHSSAQTTIRINEVYTRGVAGNLDWVEIYNTAAAPIDISGFKIYDAGGKTGAKTKKLFPAGTVVPAKGFVVIATDTATYAGDQSAFGLGSGGDSVWVENAAGALLDSVYIPALGLDTTFARVPDGSKTWVKTSPATKGVSNVVIKMNEIYANGVAGALDWIELYNSSAAAVNISGYKIYDIGGQSGSKGKKLIPAGTNLASKGFFVVIVDTASFAGDTTGFGLSSAGETVWLENASGVVIDTVAFPAMVKDTSYARKPDGSNAFVKLTPTSRGVTNGTATSVKQTGTAAESYSLEQNYPNPFNPSTTIRFALPGAQLTTVTVYDVLGKKVATLVNEVRAAGTHSVQFDARGLTSGMYWYLLRAGAYSEIKKMIVVK